MLRNYLFTLLILFISNSHYGYPVKLKRVFNLGLHIISIEQMNRRELSIHSYTVFDTIFTDIKNKDSVFWRLKIYDARTYAKYIDSNIFRAEVLRPRKKQKLCSLIRIDSVFIKCDSIFNIYFVGSNYKIIVSKKERIISNNDLFFFTSAPLNDGDFYKIKLFKNINLIYGKIDSLLFEYDSSSKTEIDWSNCIWIITEK